MYLLFLFWSDSVIYFRYKNKIYKSEKYNLIALTLLFPILIFSTKRNVYKKSPKTGLQSSKNPGKLTVPKKTKVRFGTKKE